MISQTVQLTDETKLVGIRNPWASETEWTGRFSDADLAATNPDLLAQLGTGDADDGTFWMDINDFVRWVGWGPIRAMAHQSICIRHTIPVL
jgi:hypothetical protein